MDEILGIVETGIYAEDLDRAEAFYRDVLGLPLLFKEANRHVFFQAGDRNVLLIFKPETTLQGRHPARPRRSGPGHFALGVPAGSLEAWRQRLARHGVAVEKQVHWPAGGDSIYFRDPAGNSVELITQHVWGLPSGW